VTSFVSDDGFQPLKFGPSAGRSNRGCPKSEMCQKHPLQLDTRQAIYSAVQH